MKIGEAKPIDGSKGVTAATGTKAEKVEKVGPAPIRSVVDLTSVMGIPAAELTPKVYSAIMTLMAEVDRLRRELEQDRARLSYLERLADQDYLVPVSNRRAFVRELSRMMSFSERYGVPASLLYFDIDSMKRVNDTHGHAAGDAALVHVAEVLVNNVRESDVVGRIGGDEFGVILAQADHAAAQEKANMLVGAIKEHPFEWAGEKIPLTLAYGAYTFRSGEGVSDALDAADRAMYARKQAREKNV